MLHISIYAYLAEIPKLAAGDDSPNPIPIIPVTSRREDLMIHPNIWVIQRFTNGL